ncbi:putative Early nodulin 55-2 [Melia azedarach]|uniref:Early nodulin 55-2 n=1 Tax=Melia azedarach TaxID=155640 RepID=A0ACC1YE81_MELAZ|nr:putative Early nodulin 55-2 [Melia azedarach]
MRAIEYLLLDHYTHKYPMAFHRTFIIFALVSVFVATITRAKEFIVGDTTGWTTGFDRLQSLGCRQGFSGRRQTCFQISCWSSQRTCSK